MKQRYFVTTSCMLMTALAVTACDPEPAPVVTQDAVADTKDDPDTFKSDTNQPDTSKPDTNQPDTSKPDTAVPDTSVPDTSVPDTAVPDTNQPDGDIGPDGPLCAADSSACQLSEECCSGICTFSLGNYGDGQCISPLIDGSYCEADNWCQSNSCVDSQCASSSCTAEGAVCYTNDTCCTGKCSVGAASLDPGTCIVPVANGQSCINNNYCVSNFCDDGVCGASTCSAADEACNTSDDCCSGLCSNASYFGSLCVAPQPDGYSCQGPEFCAGGVCDNGICGSGQQCLVEGSPCDFQCCDGLYCPSSFSNFKADKCSAKEADGSYCVDNSWCVSGQCHNSQCKPATCTVATETCGSDADCCSGLCHDGACGVVVGTGMACSENKQCASDNCSAGTCGPAAVTFTDVYNDVLIPNGCTSSYCHGTGAASTGVGLDFATEAAAFSSLLYNVANIEGCGMSRYVVPHNADVSIMWHRARPAAMDGADPCFEKKMPLNSMGLEPAAAAIVEAWINSGATM